MSEELRKERTFELRLGEYLDRYQTDQVKKGYPRQRTVKPKSGKKKKKKLHALFRKSQ